MTKLLNNTSEITNTRLILLVACFLILSDNVTFFSNVIDVYPLNLKNSLFLPSLALVFGGIVILLLSLVCYKYTIKPVLIGVLLISSSVSYFMDSYHVVIDDSMINNILNTDFAESLDLFSIKMVLYIALLGILPSIFVYKVKIADRGVKKELISRARLIVLTLVMVVSIIVVLGSFYASFFREHKSLRYYANPSFYIYSSLKYFNAQSDTSAHALKVVGQNAHIPEDDNHRELMIFVLGETAREDRFSINGYKRTTNPLLAKKDIVSFTDFWACGTSTAASVPCIFSPLTENEYSDAKAKETENLLDVLQHAGVNVLWLDNNSDSKGVALRAEYRDYKTPESNPVCDIECRDEGMLAAVQSYIDTHEHGDIFIVLHQMGNHGPAYYKRYPKEFERFTPVCDTNQLEDCSQEEIDNAYDNAILYTDYLLSKTIDLLEKNNNKFEPALFYVSDHGESLGENGLYLHGMPRFIAPDVQLHVPAILWAGKNFDEIKTVDLSYKKNKTYTHDNVFHTVLGFMEIESSIYNKGLDIIHSN